MNPSLCPHSRLYSPTPGAGHGFLRAAGMILTCLSELSHPSGLMMNRSKIVFLSCSVKAKRGTSGSPDSLVFLSGSSLEVTGCSWTTQHNQNPTQPKTREAKQRPRAWLEGLRNFPSEPEDRVCRGFTLCDYLLFWYSSKAFGGKKKSVISDFASGYISHDWNHYKRHAFEFALNSFSFTIILSVLWRLLKMYKMNSFLTL